MNNFPSYCYSLRKRPFSFWKSCEIKSIFWQLIFSMWKNREKKIAKNKHPDLSYSDKTIDSIPSPKKNLNHHRKQQNTFHSCSRRVFLFCASEKYTRFFFAMLFYFYAFVMTKNGLREQAQVTYKIIKCRSI